MWGASVYRSIKFTAIVAMISLALVLSGCGKQDKNDEIIAEFEGGHITQSQFDTHVGAMFFLGQQPMEALDDAYKSEILHQLIAMEIIAKGADQDIWKTESKAANEEFTLMKEQFLFSFTNGEWKDTLKEYKTDEKGIKQFLEVSRVVGEVLDRDITEELIEAEYEKLKEEHVFDKIGLSHILVAIDDITPEGVEEIRTLDEAKVIVEQIKARLDEGESFADLAAAYSDDTATAEEGGVLPEMNGAQLTPVFGEALLDMSVGEISEPIAMEYGYHIIKVNSRETEQLADFDEETLRQLRGYIVSTKFMDFVETELPTKIKQINM